MEDDIADITSAEIEKALRKMENGKATARDNLPVSVEEFGGNKSEFIREALNKITDEQKIPYIL